jgi:hypothetical protein
MRTSAGAVPVAATAAADCFVMAPLLLLIMPATLSLLLLLLCRPVKLTCIAFRAWVRAVQV